MVAATGSRTVTNKSAQMNATANSVYKI